MEQLIGREKELAQLQRCMDSDRSELVIVYGRRRVGKTFLVDHFFDGKYDFSFVGGHRLTQRLQLRNFAKALKQAMGENQQRVFNNWFDAFDALEEYLQSLTAHRKKVVFFDEMPWIDTLKSNFTAAFENFWNSWAARRSDIMFVASGSATSWMVDKLVDNQGGLHARITQHIYLQPFTLLETEKYLNGHGCQWDRFQIAQCYMLLGGIPFYLSLLDTRLSLVQNVDLLCFARGGALQLEFDELYNALFTYADNYIDVVRLLANHRNGLTNNEISNLSKIEGKQLKKILANLERCDFIMKFSYFGKKSRDSLYRLADFYTLFYFKYIEPNKESHDEHWWSHHHDSHSVESWQGLSFELLCLLHINEIKTSLGFAGVATEVSTWFEKADKEKGIHGSQIDLIIERADRIIHLCEMKFCQDGYHLTSEYVMKLRERMGLFREKTKTRKALVNTFVTTFGVTNKNSYSLVHSEVTLDDLFKKPLNINFGSFL